MLRSDKVCSSPPARGHKGDYICFCIGAMEGGRRSEPMLQGKVNQYGYTPAVIGILRRWGAIMDTWALENKRLIAAFVQEIFVRDWRRWTGTWRRTISSTILWQNRARPDFKKFFAAWFDAVPNWKYPPVRSLPKT